jgi:hypothetical protein
MVRQSKQKACDGYFHTAVRDNYNPCIPPGNLEEHDHEIRPYINKILDVTAYPIVGKSDEQGEAGRAHSLK